MSFLSKIFAITRCRSFNCISQTSHFMCSSTMVAEKFKEITNTDFLTIKNIWQSEGDSLKVKNFLWKRFTSERNCFSYVLHLMSLVPHNTSGKTPEIALGIMFSFNDWLKQNAVTEELNFHLKRTALEMVVSQKNFLLVQIVCDVFKIHEQKMDFKGICEILIAEEKFEEAILCIAALGLQEEVPLEMISAPMAMDKSVSKSVICKYFQGHDKLFQEFLKYVDNQIGILQENPNLKIRDKKVTPYGLFKFLSVFLHQFSWNYDQFPNAKKIKDVGTLNFLIKKKLHNSVPEKGWEESVLDVVGDNLELKKKLVEKLAKHNDTETASKFAQLFKLPSSCLSPGETSNRGEGSLNDSEEGEDTTPSYYTLDLDPSQIKFVSTPDDFFKCLEDISQNMGIVGLDSEWKPVFGSRNANRLSLMQLAVRDKVYILDMLELSTCLSSNHWDYFMQEFLANPNVTKLGCGIVQDLQMLIEFYHSIKKETVRFSHVIDVAILYQKMDQLFDYEEDSEENSFNMKGLSKLCQIILGKPLNKVERFCDWEQRPLTNTQLTYAALDAYCLVQMYDAMKKQAIQKGKVFDNYITSSAFLTTSMTKLACKSNRHLKWVRSGLSFTYRPLKTIQDFKVIVDDDLPDIGTKLRMYGVDVHMMSAENIYKNSFQIVNEEDRILIGSESLAEKAKGELSSEKCYIVTKGYFSHFSSNITAPIFQYFNVQMSSSAIFSRCIHCNGEDFVEVSSEVVKKLIENKSVETSTSKETEPCNSTKETTDDSTIDSQKDIYAKMKLDNIHPAILSKINVFKVCSNCGNALFQK